MPNYKVKTPLKGTDGVIEPGETVDLPAKAARELIACGAIEELAPPAARDDKAKAAAKSDGDEEPKGKGDKNEKK